MSLSVIEKEYTSGIPAFCKEEKKYWKTHPNYTKEEEYKKMSEEEEYAYKYLQRIADTSYWRR